MKRTSNTHGFSLLELMIVVAIVGILAAVAFPAYVSHIYRIRETTMHQYILDVQAAQEKFYALNDRYENNVADPNFTQHLGFSTAGTQFYKLTLVVATTNTYTAQIAADINRDNDFTNCRRISQPPSDPQIFKDLGGCKNDEGFEVSLIPGLF